MTKTLSAISSLFKQRSRPNVSLLYQLVSHTGSSSVLLVWLDLHELPQGKTGKKIGDGSSYFHTSTGAMFASMRREKSKVFVHPVFSHIFMKQTPTRGTRYFEMVAFI